MAAIRRYGRFAILAMLLPFTFGTGSDVEHCQNADWKGQCHKQIMNAMVHEFAKDPDSFPGLSVRSSFSDFQGFFWNQGMHGCPRPCMPREEVCVKFGPSYPCYQDVHWAMREGIGNHPDWYPELGPQASALEVAQVLYRHGQPNCPRPCDADEGEGHAVPYTASSEFADSESWMAPKTTQTTTLTTFTRTGWAANLPAAPQPISIELLTVPPRAIPVSMDDAMLKPTTTTTKETTTKLTTPQPTTTTKLTTPQPTTTDPCLKTGITYSHLDMKSAPAKMVGSAGECRSHCRGIDGAGYFLFFGPLSVCRCVPAEEGEEQPADSNFIGGSVNCGASSDAENKETDTIVQRVEDKCFEVDSAYVSFRIEDPPIDVKDSLECQQKLLESKAEHFVFTPLDGLCRFVHEGATKMWTLGAISGPRHCEGFQVESKAKSGKVIENPLSPDRVVQHLKIGAGMISVLLLAFGAFVGSRRRLEPVRARHFRSTSRSISEHDLEAESLHFDSNGYQAELAE
eukprot:TRINITY_DN58615_c0_g1_i1.p1 TRINITY_DN58615_c0_g1~~TRINITY_DN58615_c0_g1_i1.p1  ORF type:complete len:513 (-),score=73.40 TRINITY_DN58615_c0_g1_i1:287-1825(-)